MKSVKLISAVLVVVVCLSIGFIMKYPGTGLAAGDHIFPLPYQVKDINPGLASSSPSFIAGQTGNTVLFSADDGTHGSELWTSDGLSLDTKLVKDINSGSGTSFSGYGVTVNGVVFFPAMDGVHGWELWCSDGTKSGTYMVKDIAPGEPSGYPGNFAVLDGIVYFSASDGNHGTELWKSDGTETGTVMVRDINPGGGSEPEGLVVYKNEIYFSASDGNHGTELWKSDGTEAGTMMIRDIRPAAPGSSPSNLVPVDGVLFFTANDGIHGKELWKSDGTETGTVMVKDIQPAGYQGSTPHYLTAFKGMLVFTTWTDSHLWKSDGTASGTVVVTNDVSAVTNLSVVGNVLYFSGDDTVHGAELWRSDGTEGGTSLVKDIAPAAQDSSPSQMTDASYGKFVFVVNNDEIWESDGTAGRTSLLRKLDENGNSNPVLFRQGGMVFISAKSYSTYPQSNPGRELWALSIDDHTPPVNPNYIDEAHGVVDGQWQEAINNPEFSWAGASDAHSGVAGYRVYFGTDPQGSAETFVTSAEYSPEPLKIGGTYYFRVSTRDNAGNNAAWKTMFTFRYQYSGAVIYLPVVSMNSSHAIQESEPNNTFGEANPISALPAVVAGHHDGSANTGDVFLLDDIVTAGNVLEATVFSGNSAGLQLIAYDPDGNEITRDYDDNHHISFVVPASGSYYIYVFTDPDVNNTAAYELQIKVTH